MGTVLEGLWLYTVNRDFQLRHDDRWELAWLPDHEYNDFALLTQGCTWNRATGEGEILRVEAKSMVIGADESKAHFDEIVTAMGAFDQVLVLVWKWEEIASRVQPVIIDAFLGPALNIARLRDELHRARGGSFVDREACPDECVALECLHHGEPLNADGKRERVTGPQSRRVSATTSFGNNFGGMVRMLHTRNAAARAALRRVCRVDTIARDYVGFVWKHFPSEHTNHYASAEWRQFARANGIDVRGLDRSQIAAMVRSRFADAAIRMLAAINADPGLLPSDNQA